MRVQEAAKALGVSERHLRDFLPELPKFHFGASVLLPVDQLIDWMRDQVAAEKKREESALEAVFAELDDGHHE